MTNDACDILGLGVATVDDIVVLEHFPVVNDKQPVLRTIRQCGGLTATALVAAARLGCRCGHIINLGDSDLARFIRGALSKEGIVLVEPPGPTAAEPYYAIILSEQNTGERAILWSMAKHGEPVIGEAEMAMVVKAGCLFVDHAFPRQTIPAAQAARKAGVPVVGDFERNDNPESLELMQLVDHLILPLGYASRNTGASSPEEVVKALLRAPGRALACVTDSERGCWFGTDDGSGQVKHQPAFRVEQVLDSTGCGDVFHGAYAVGLVQGLPAAERIRRASAAAALKAGKYGAQSGAPTLDELEAFLKNQ